MSKIVNYTNLFFVPSRYIRNLIKKIVQSAWYYSICRNSVVSENVKSIEFICYGNICRSIFAEKYADAFMKKRGFPVISSSSGLFAKEGSVPPAEACRAASLFNVDLANHYSRKTSGQSIKDADLVLCMHFNQFMKIRKSFPFVRHKLFLLKAFNDKSTLDLNIDDPYGKELDVYIRCFKEIVKHVGILIDRIETRHSLVNTEEKIQVSESEN